VVTEEPTIVDLSEDDGKRVGYGSGNAFVIGVCSIDALDLTAELKQPVRPGAKSLTSDSGREFLPEASAGIATYCF
jgi:hypothetical protein